MSLDTHEENDLIDFLEDNGLLGVIDAEGVQFRDGGESVVGLGNNIATDADNNLTAQTGSTLEVQDDGSAVDSGVNVLNLVSNIQATQASQGEVDLTIPQDAIGGSEIDQSSSLTWTSDQQFNSTIIAGGDVVPDTDGTGNLGTDAKTWGAVQTGKIKGGVANNLSVDRLLGERLAAASPTNVSEVDFVSEIKSDFGRYRIEFIDVVPDTDIARLSLRVTTDGGSTFEEGSGAYAWGRSRTHSDGFSGSDSNDSDSKIELSRDVGSDSGEGLTGHVSLSDPTNANLEQVVEGKTACHAPTDGRVEQTDYSGMYLTAEAIDGVRIFFDSGNIDSGQINLYGVMN